MKRLLALLILVAAAYAGFRWGGKVFPPLTRLLGHGPETSAAREAPVPSRALADSTLDRVERLRDRKGPTRLALGGTELTSVVRYALPGTVPSGVSDPTISLSDGHVDLSARLALHAFPRLPHLDRVVGVLPDTVLLEIHGALVRTDQEHVALLVDRMKVLHVPLPKALIGDVLSGLGSEPRKDALRDALVVPLPDGLSTAFVERDSLILLARR